MTAEQLAELILSQQRERIARDYTQWQADAPDFMAAVSAVLGRPGYGYSWYRVKR
jgi:hypothetical protein